jgi:hypothetical protein
MTEGDHYKPSAGRIVDESQRADFDRALRREMILEEVRGNLYPRTQAQRVSMGILFVSLAFVSAVAFFHDHPSTTPLVAAGLIGSFCLAMYYPKPGYHFVGAFSGFVLGVGIVLANVGYLAIARAMSRTFMADFELVMPFAVGCLPGFVLYYLFASRKALRDSLRSGAHREP